MTEMKNGQDKAEMKQVTEQDGQSVDVVADNIEQLKTLFPEAFKEDGIDFTVLRQLLGDAKVLGEGEEKYGLNWHGKKKARQIALTPSMGTLRPCPEESVDWDNTQNLFIEGDNLEVLKLLQKSYANKVKMIYIDPPYNTGKEFVYPDNYQDNLDTYLKYTGQVDEDGLVFSTNKETSGRKHTNWLNMMYSRLKLARSLLADDGILVVSIDENEHTNLIKIMEDIFGQENFCGEIVWKNSSKNDQNYISIQHEYFVVFVKNKNENKGEWVEKKDGLSQIYKAFEGFKKRYGNDWAAIHLAALEWFRKFPDSNPIRDSKHYNWMDSAGVYFPDNISGPNVGQYVYDVSHPKTQNIVKPPSRGWFCPEEKMIELIQSHKVHFGIDETTVPCLKTYLNKTETKSLTSLKFKDGRAASKRLRVIFGNNIFTNPKDEDLLFEFLKAFNINGEDIVLDFFAGSATTQHSVFKINIEQSSNCRVILVQLPEDIKKIQKSATGLSKKIAKNALEYLKNNGLPQNICEIAKKRIKLTSAKIKKENPNYKGDLGFKVFKLDSSNIRSWNPRPDKNQAIGDLLEQNQDHLIEGRTEQDILYELLLKRGVPLTVPIEQIDCNGKTIYSIGYGILFACLDTSITKEDVEPLAQAIIAWHTELKPEEAPHIFFRDSAFSDDNAKTNLAAILAQNSISHVRSL